MNKILKQILKIADKEKIEIISINPICKKMKEMEVFFHLFRSISDDYSLELDSVYITFIEDGVNVLFPVIDDKVIEDLVLKIDPSKINEMLEQYYEMEDKKENEEIGLFN